MESLSGFHLNDGVAIGLQLETHLGTNEIHVAPSGFGLSALRKDWTVTNDIFTTETPQSSR